MYEVIIKKIITTEYQETDTRYVNKGTREPCSYTDPDSVLERYETGKKLKREDVTEVYTQRIEELDVASLAVFLNQK